MMGRKYWALVAVLSICALVGAGCKRKSSKNSNTVSSDDDIFTSDSFPGAPVQDGNVADDGRAMSISGDDFSGGLNYFPNGDRGQGVVTYKVGSGQLYAHYYNGTWTPPVALTAIDAVNTSSSSYTVVAFVNPVDDGDEFAGDRAGDAYIFWTADDTDDDGGGSDSANEVLFATHVDASNVADVTLRYGFQEFATRISDQDEAGESIQTIGLVSDGLCGEARWSDGNNTYEWGQDTTAFIVFWNQIENDSAGFDQTTYAVRFNPSEATDADVPLTPSSPDTRVPIQAFGASDSGATSEQTITDTLYASYNNFLFSRLVSDNIVGADAVGLVSFAGDNIPSNDDDDETIQSVQFNLAAGTVSGAVSLNPGATDSSTDTDENVQHFLQPDFDTSVTRSIYGSDEGLGVMVVYTTAVVEDPDGDAADVTDSFGILLTEVNESTGGVITNSFVNFRDAAIIDNVFINRVDTRISRNGDYIVAAWLQPEDTGGTDDLSVWGAVYHTSRPDEDGVTTLLAIGTSLDPATLCTIVDTDGDPAIGIQFQDNLGYICGGQSDPDQMYFMFEQSDTVSGTDQYLVSVLNDPSTETSIFSTGFYESFIEDEQGWFRFNEETEDFNFTDAGNDGGLIIAYRQDITTLDDDDRTFCERTGFGAGFSEIGSAVTFRQSTGSAEIIMVGTPRGSDIGEFDDADASDSEARPHGFNNVHIIIREDESQEDSGLGNALRTRQYRSDGDLAFAEAFIPSIAGGTFEFPFDLDLPFVDPSTSLDASPVGLGVSGDKVGIWFTELQHLYYQEFNGGNDNDAIGWLNSEGQSNPFLVDDDNDEELNNFVEFFENHCSCDTLDHAVAFWTKTYGSGAGGGQTIRLQVRVRAGE